MLKLLNSFAWFLCFTLCFTLGNTFFGREMLDGGFIVAIIAAVILKWFMFPKDYILSRLHFFKTQILKDPTILEGEQNQEVTKAGEYKEHLSDLEKHQDSDTQIYTEEYKTNDEEKENTYTQNQYIPSSDISEKAPGVIEKFFSENIIAKIGGIILFIGVFVFLSAIYTIIGPVTKIIIGFVIGCGIYAIGVFLDKQGFINESRVTLGIGILVNYLVILSGRYILGEPVCQEIIGGVCSTDYLLTVGTTFLFLILNTIFAVLTALIYKSRTLLIFGFVFAYLNPFLLGTSSSEPYTLLAYTMIVTLGALYMSYSKRDEILFPLSFILAGCIFLIAPFSDANAWIAKLLCINLLGVLGIYISTVFQNKFSQIFETMIAGIFFLIGIMGILSIDMGISQIQLVLMGISSIGLMLISYSKAQGSASLYSIGTLASIISLSPVLLSVGLEQGKVTISTIIIFLVGISNIGFTALQNKQFLRENLKNIITGLLTASLFLSGMLLFYGNEFFPGVSLGFAFFGLASIYAGLAFYTSSKIGIEDMKKDENYANIFYTISAIALSIFTLAIAIVFGNNTEIIAVIWLLEANVLFFLSQKTQSFKIAIAGLVLLIIGILQFIKFGYGIGNNLYGSYSMLVPTGIILISLLMNLKILFHKDISFLPKGFYGIHNFFHVIGICLIILTGSEILMISGDWNALLYLSISVVALGEIYKRISSAGLQITYWSIFIGLMILHISIFGDSMGREKMNLILSTSIVAIYTLPFIYEKYIQGAIRNKLIFGIYALYIFILSSLYVFEIFQVTFAVTLYWGILSFGFLRQGINNDTVYLRTLGLYLLTLTVGKIFLYDLWQSGVDDGVAFIVFIATGALMIAMSTMYTRKYGNNLNHEFNPSNIFQTDFLYGSNKKDATKQETSAHDVSEIQKNIEAIDVSDLSSVKLQYTNNESIIIRAENLMKIAKLIINTYKKTEFKKGELSAVYQKIESNYKSHLPANQYTKIRSLVKRFVDEGGSIELIKK